MKTIAVAINKGGVGKTAVVLALADLLNEKGYKTLIVDLDEQMNATQQARVKTDDVVTAYDLLTTDEYSAKEAIQKHERGYIIPGDELVSDADVAISKQDTPLTMLADALEAVKEEYDYIIIDCPPSLGLVSRNAIVAADEVIVVVKPEEPSVSGFGKIVSHIEKIKRNKRLNPNVKISGVLINFYDSRKTLSKELDKSLAPLAEKVGTRVFKTRIRVCEEICKANSAHVSIFDQAPKCNGAIDFRAFVDEYLELEAK